MPKKSTSTGPFSITIDPGCYTGVYQVWEQNVAKLGAAAGMWTLRLEAGKYEILVAAGTISFSISATGAIQNVTPSNSAFLAPETKDHLIFGNSKIVIDPDVYDGTYYPAGNDGDTMIPLRGRKTIVVVPGLKWYVWVYGRYGGTQILFDVDARGRIVASSVTPTGSAVADGSRLLLQTTAIIVDPTDFTSGYILAGHYCEPSNGKLEFALIKALTCYIEFYGCGSTHEVVFEVDSNGAINPRSVSNRQAVTAVNLSVPGPSAKLVVNTQPVFVSTDFTGRYRIGSRYFQKAVSKPGKKGRKDRTPDLVMVKNFGTIISIIETATVDITPLQTGMSPAEALVQDADGGIQKFDFAYSG